MRTHVLTSSIDLPRPIGEVFAFFSDAGNLQALTPAWVNFEVLTPRPIPMHAGALIDYRLRIHGVPIRWRTRIETWEPPESHTHRSGERRHEADTRPRDGIVERARFVDVQLRGPYRLWHHTHTFESLPASAAMPRGGTRCGDRVEYAAPGWVLEPLVHSLFVKRDVERIFTFRGETLKRLFPASGEGSRAINA
jgi:ligand-binding SRPBCC domain-containing protein